MVSGPPEKFTPKLVKAKANVRFGVKYLCGHECERSSVQLISKAKAKEYYWGIYFTLISLSTVSEVSPVFRADKTPQELVGQKPVRKHASHVTRQEPIR